MPHDDFPVLLRRVRRLGILFTGFVLLAFAAFLVFLVFSRATDIESETGATLPGGFLLGVLLMIMVVAMNAVFIWLSGHQTGSLRDKITRDLTR